GQIGDGLILIEGGELMEELPGDVDRWRLRGLVGGRGRVLPPARSDDPPDRHHRDRGGDPHDARRDALGPALAVPAAHEPLPRGFGPFEQIEGFFEALPLVDHRRPSAVARAIARPFVDSARTVDAWTPRIPAASLELYPRYPVSTSAAR